MVDDNKLFSPFKKSLMVDDNKLMFLRRITALKNAHILAKNPEFKKLWADITEKLIVNERGRIEDERLFEARGKKYA